MSRPTIVLALFATSIGGTVPAAAPLTAPLTAPLAAQEPEATRRPAPPCRTCPASTSPDPASASPSSPATSPRTGRARTWSAWLAGVRLADGSELGVGPDFSFSDDTQDTTTSMVIALGKTVPPGDIYLPVNLAIALAKGGPRITTLFGWIIG